MEKDNNVYISQDHDLKEYHDPIKQSQMIGGIYSAVSMFSPWIRIPFGLIFCVIPSIFMLVMIFTLFIKDMDKSFGNYVFLLFIIFISLLYFTIGIRIIVGRKKKK